jgi:CRISPR-associated protein Csy2
MSQNYIIIPRIEVLGANAQSAWWVVSGPSPLAYLGLVRNIAIRLGMKDSHKIKIAIIHHDIEYRGEYNQYGDFLPAQYKGASLTSSKDGPHRSKDYAAGSLSMGLQPTALCNIKASLVIEGMDSVSNEDIAKQLSICRLAGGQIQKFGKLASVEYHQVFSSVSSGFFLKDQSQLLEGSEPSQLIPKFMEILRPKFDENNKKIKNEQWLSPMSLGYIPISEPTYKTNTRLDLPHAYAEPLVGLIEYLPKGKMQPDDLQNLFWGYRQRGKALVVDQFSSD